MKKHKNAVFSLFITLSFAVTTLIAVPLAQAQPPQAQVTKVQRILQFELLETETDDAFWAGKENMIYDFDHTSALGLDDQGSDWWGYDKDFTGHLLYSEIGFDCTQPPTATQDYYFKNLPSEGKFTLLIQCFPVEPVKPINITGVDIDSWALPNIELHQKSSFTAGDEGYAYSAGTYDPATNAIDAAVNLNIDFKASGNQNAWANCYSQVGYLIPHSEFGDLPGTDDYPITVYCPGNPGGGYPDEYIPCGTVDIGEWLEEIVQLPEVMDETHLYVGISRDNFKNDETGTVGKRFVDGGNLFIVDASEWPILGKPFLNMESVWVAVSKPLQAIPAIPKE